MKDITNPMPNNDAKMSEDLEKEMDESMRKCCFFDMREWALFVFRCNKDLREELNETKRELERLEKENDKLRFHLKSYYCKIQEEISQLQVNLHVGKLKNDYRESTKYEMEKCIEGREIQLEMLRPLLTPKQQVKEESRYDQQ